MKNPFDNVRLNITDFTMTDKKTTEYFLKNFSYKKDGFSYEFYSGLTGNGSEFLNTDLNGGIYKIVSIYQENNQKPIKGLITHGNMGYGDYRVVVNIDKNGFDNTRLEFLFKSMENYEIILSSFQKIFYEDYKNDFTINFKNGLASRMIS